MNFVFCVSPRDDAFDTGNKSAAYRIQENIFSISLPNESEDFLCENLFSIP